MLSTVHPFRSQVLLQSLIFLKRSPVHCKHLVTSGLRGVWSLRGSRRPFSCLQYLLCKLVELVVLPLDWRIICGCCGVHTALRYCCFRLGNCWPCNCWPSKNNCLPHHVGIVNCFSLLMHLLSCYFQYWWCEVASCLSISNQTYL